MKPLITIIEDIVKTKGRFIQIINSDINTGKNFGFTQNRDDLCIRFKVKIQAIDDTTLTSSFYYPLMLVNAGRDDVECLINLITDINFDIIFLFIKSAFPNMDKCNSPAYISGHSFTNGYIGVRIYDENTQEYKKVYYTIPTNAFDGKKFYLGKVFDKETLEKLMSGNKVQRRCGGLMEQFETECSSSEIIESFDITDNPELITDDPSQVVDLDGLLLLDFNDENTE